MRNKIVKIGNLTLEFQGSWIWIRKALININAQIEWLNENNINNYIEGKLHIIYRQSNDSFFDINNNKNNNSNKIVIGIKNWFDANSSILFQLAAILNNCVLVHGNCLITNTGTDAHIFTAKGGVGKTSMLLEALHKDQKSFEFGGDDLVWLNPVTKTVLPYYRPMCVYKYHYSTFKPVFKSIKIRFLSPSILYRIINVLSINLQAFIGLNKISDFYDSLNIVPNNRYYLLDPITFFNIKQSKGIKIKSIGYLENAKKFFRKEIEKAELINLISSSTLDEFKAYSTILSDFCLEKFNMNFHDYLRMSVNLALDNQNKYYKVNTTGKWSMKEIEKIII